MSKPLLIGVAAVVLLGGGAGAAYLLGFFGSSDAQAESAEPAPVEPAGLLAMEEFLTNINDPSGERFAKLVVRLAIAPEERAAEIEGDAVLRARMRDTVLTLLTSKTFAELNNPQGKEAFRNEIRDKLAPLTKDAEIREVLFSEFVVQ